MKKFLVIGNPIQHSLSPKLHNFWFKKYGFLDHVYEKKEIVEKDLINITQDIKNDVAQFLYKVFFDYNFGTCIY